jgi:hypothetical protein
VERDTVRKTASLCNKNGLPIASNFPRPLRARYKGDHSTMHRYPGTPVSPHSRFAYHGWLTPAAHGRTVLVAEEITTFAVQKRMFSRAAGVSPPWFGFALATAIVYFRLSAFAGHDRFPHHGGLTPPALVSGREHLPGKTIFAMHTRTSTRAAGVSPPWVPLCRADNAQRMTSGE